MIRSPTNKLAVANTRPVPSAKEAILDYRLLSSTENRYLYEIELITGRFHQIRAQFAATGAPIIGDAAYGSQHLLGDQQIALHAYSLAFPDPNSDELVEVIAPLPDYWPIPE